MKNYPVISRMGTAGGSTRRPRKDGTPGRALLRALVVFMLVTAGSVAAALLVGAIGNTVIIAPHFAAHNGRSCRDSLADNEINWTCSGNSWRAGISASHRDVNAPQFAIPQ